MSLIDVNVAHYRKFPDPATFARRYPVTPAAAETLQLARATVQAILDGSDRRRLLITGPCSIHNVTEALDYATKLRTLQAKVNGIFVLLMRTYFEKPRTTTGWKGLLHDPAVRGNSDLENGLSAARELLVRINGLGIPCATETLGPLVPQYLGDLVSWTSIGARTTESQTHRELASGLSVPVGFKNGTNGRLDVAINAMKSAQHPHSFLGVDADGKIVEVRTRGNKYCHLVLRGGTRPNYDRESVNLAVKALETLELPSRIIVDCSHGNSGKDHKKQHIAFRDVVAQMDANAAIKGVMLESNLQEGKQEATSNPVYGVSITDACISWEETERLVLEAAEHLKQGS